MLSLHEWMNNNNIVIYMNDLKNCKDVHFFNVVHVCFLIYFILWGLYAQALTLLFELEVAIEINKATNQTINIFCWFLCVNE